MNDQQQDKPDDKLPLAASLSGKNMHIIQCVPVGRGMQYASCLARQGALNTLGVKVPDDWKECGRHKVHNDCAADIMRKEELAKGCSIYFRASGTSTAPVSRRWGESSIVQHKPKWSPDDNVATKSVRGPVVARTAVQAPKPPPKQASIADAIGNAGTYADAINQVMAAAEHSKQTNTPVVTAVQKPITTIKPESAPPQILTSTTSGIHPTHVGEYLRKVAFETKAMPPLANPNPNETPLQMARRIRAEREARS